MTTKQSLFPVVLLSAFSPAIAQLVQQPPSPAQGQNTSETTRMLSAGTLELSPPLGALPLTQLESNIEYDKAVTVTIHLKNLPPALTKAVKPPPDRTLEEKLHFISGFDEHDKPVSQLTFADANEKRRREHVNDVQHIRVRDGRTTLLDSTNSPLPVPSAAGALQPNLLGNLHSRVLSSPLGSVIIKDVDHFASVRHGSVSHDDPNVAVVTLKSRDKTTALTYERRSDRWVLTTQATTRDSATSIINETARFSNVKWLENSDGDERRKMSTTPIALQIAETSDSSLGFSKDAYNQAARGRKQPESRLARPADRQVAAASPLAVSNNVGAGGSDVVFLHGFLSSGSTWDRMVPWLSSDFPFSSTYAPSYGSGGKDSLISWAQEADGDLSARGTNYLAIGHSAGGLVGRSLAISDPSTVRGIITVDTPFQGAMSLKNGFGLIQQAAIYGVGIAAGEACAAFDFTDCGVLSGTLGFVAIAGVDAYVGFDYGAALDLYYKSPYTQLIDAVPVLVPHAFVATLSDSRWLEYRLGADSFSYPDDSLGGRNVVLLAEGAYDGLYAIGFIWDQYAQDYYNQDDEDDGDFYEQLSGNAFNAAYYMDEGDYYFNYFVTTDLASGDYDPDGSDGVVQFASQFDPDPSAPGRIIQWGDDHLAATKSSYVRTAVDHLLQLQLFTPPVVTPTNCSYSIAPLGSSTVSYMGGFVILHVTTQPTCAWTLTPNSSFVQTADLSGSGTGSGNTEVFFAVNIADYPLQGSLTLVNQPVTIQQDAKPNNVGVGIVAMRACTPQDNCTQTGSGESYFSISIAGVTNTEDCGGYAANCFERMADDLTDNFSVPVTAVLDEFTFSRIFIFSNDPAFANASLSASVTNGTPALTFDPFFNGLNPTPAVVSVSGPNLVP